MRSPELLIKFRLSSARNRYLSISLYLPGKKTLSTAAIENQAWKEAEKLPHDRVAMAAFTRFLQASETASKPADAVELQFPPFTVIAPAADDEILLVGFREEYHRIPLNQRLQVAFNIWEGTGVDLIQKDEIEDLIPPTGDQLEQAKFFSRFKGLPLPPSAYKSRSHLFSWIAANLTRVDRDKANEMAKDFYLKVDFDNPMSIIGALKYWEKAQESDQLRIVVRLMREGLTPAAIFHSYGYKSEILERAEQIVRGTEVLREEVDHCVRMLIEGNHPDTIRDCYPDYSEAVISRAIKMIETEHPEVELNY